MKVNLSKDRVKDLEDKIQKSKNIFQKTFDRFGIEDMRLIWSGGKDSTLTTWICPFKF